jgi:hypothetical protein
MRLHEIRDYLTADSEVDEMLDELLQTLGKLALMCPLVRQDSEQASTETGNGRHIDETMG